jgi:hypothetical protein
VILPRARPKAGPSDCLSISGSGTGPEPPSLEDTVRELQPFVQAERGLAFKSDVPVVVLSGADFDARTTSWRRLPTRERAEQRDAPPGPVLNGGVIAT